MKSNSLSIIFKTTQKLEEINHPDALRISKEICEFTNFKEDDIEKILLRLSLNEPWEYIRGYTEFDENKIFVNGSTLIPRLETLQILEIFKEFKNVKNVIDVGCGSGAIGISIAKRYPTLSVKLVDISEDALKISKENIKENNAERNTEIIKNNLLESIKCNPNTVVIANLPYIPTSQYLNLEKSVKDYEPRLALDGGADGLDLIKRLLDQIVNDRDIIGVILEIDPSQENTLKNILSEQDIYKYSVINDFRGLLRFLKLYL